MASSTPPGRLTLPMIDISPYLADHPNTSSLASTNASLRSALLTHGFFYLINHGIDESILDEVLRHARTFFQEAPATEKTAIRRRDAGEGFGDGARGYQVVGENVTQGQRDWHEAIDWYLPIHKDEGVIASDLVVDDGGPTRLRGARANEAAVEMERNETTPDTAKALKAKTSDMSTELTIHGPSDTLERLPRSCSHRTPPFSLLQGVNLWPSTPPTFRTVYEAYITQIRALGGVVLQAMGKALQLRDPNIFAGAAEDSFWVMRAIGYPPLPEGSTAAGGMSCGEHSDYGCLTLLLADSTPGALQVQDRVTGAWIAAEPVPGALVVNVGDMIELWTAGWVRSTLHRVMHTGEGFRVSVPFFLEPGREVVVSPLEECVHQVRAEGRTPLEGRKRYWDHLVGKIGGNFYRAGQGG